MRRWSFVLSFLLISLYLRPAMASVEIILAETTRPTGPETPVEHAIAKVFEKEFRGWRLKYPKDSTVTIDHCTLRIAGTRKDGRLVEGVVDLSRIDWDGFRIGPPCDGELSTNSFNATFVFETSQQAGYFGKRMLVSTEMPSQSALIEAIRFIQESCAH